MVALVAGTLFGAGLTLSGMTDPERVRGFLDVTGTWNPALAFVLAGAILPMAVAWRVAGRMRRPVAADAFDLPATTKVDSRLLAGAALFGVGWGLAGLCPGPAFASLVVRPVPALLFVAAMLGGMAVHARTQRRALLAASSRAPG